MAAEPSRGPHAVRGVGAAASLAEVRALISRSDELQLQLRLRLAAWREGFAAAETAHAQDYERGYADAMLEIKAVNQSLYRCFARRAELERDRWRLRGEARTRATFAEPHPLDFAGRHGAA